MTNDSFYLKGGERTESGEAGKVTVSTNGWDTTFGVTYEIMNKLIGENSTYPKKFHYEFTLSDLLSGGMQFDSYEYFERFCSENEAGSYVLDGEWDQWKLELSGSGACVSLRLPVRTGTIASAENPLPGNLDNGYVEAEVHLILEEKNSEPSRTCSITLEDNTEFSVVIRKVYFPNLSPTSLFG